MHPVEEWRWLWEQTGLVEVELADGMPDGWRMWRAWEKAVYRRRHADAADDSGPDTRILDEDGGRFTEFIRMIGRRIGEIPDVENCGEV